MKHLGMETNMAPPRYELIANLQQQMGVLSKQIEEIQNQCPHTYEERWSRSGVLTTYESACFECGKSLQAYAGSNLSNITYKKVHYYYHGCQNKASHRLYYLIGRQCPCGKEE